MTIEKLERVMWRLRSMKPGESRFTVSELRRAIMLEIGTDPRTYRANKKALKDVGFITTEGKCHVNLTGNDLTS